MSNLRPLLRCQGSRASFSALAATLGSLGSRSHVIFGFTGRDPHDVDGIADHVGGALLSFRASGHKAYLVRAQYRAYTLSEFRDGEDIMAYRYIPTGQAWINQWFRAKAVRNGGVIRRKVTDVKRYASVKLLRAEVKRRRFHLIRCGDQYIVLCNKGQIKVLQ